MASYSQSLQQQGKTVICDISAGSWEPTRPDALDLNPECFCGKGVSYDNTTHKCTGKGANQNKLDGWDEWYLDIRNPGCYSQVKAWQSKRIQSFISKGCDGIDPDNVDEVGRNWSETSLPAEADAYGQCTVFQCAGSQCDRRR